MRTYNVLLDNYTTKSVLADYYLIDEGGHVTFYFKKKSKHPLGDANSVIEYCEQVQVYCTKYWLTIELDGSV